METFPGGQPLKNRTNIVLSKDKNYGVKGAKTVHSIEELLEEIKGYPKEEIFVIGGGSVYRQLLPYCNTAHVTKINHVYEADCYFENLDASEEWEVRAKSEEQTYFDLEFSFIKYERKER